MPIDEHGAGYSRATERKQHDFAVIANAYPPIARRVLARHPTFYQRFVYVDLTAGSGLVDGRLRGSPVIMLEALVAHDVPHDAYLIDRSAGACAELRDHLNDADLGAHARVLEGDYRERIADVAERLGAYQRWAIGLVYWDENGDEPPWDTLAAITRTLPRFDLLLNVGAAYKKWQGAMGRRENTRLDERLLGLGKTHVLLRQPVEHAQWTLALCSNANLIAERGFAGQGFCLLGSPGGRDLGERLSLSKEQYRARHQPPLFGGAEL